MTARLAALAALCLATAIAGCSAGAAPGKDVEPVVPAVPAGGILLRGAGATFPSIVYKDWFERYQGAHAGTVIAYAPVGSGEGVRRFTAGEGDFGASDAALTDEEQAKVPDGAVLVPATAGSVVIAYNLPGVEPGLRLSREAYTGIFLGEITNWNDRRIARANPGVRLPDLTIVTVVRQDSSGTTFTLTNHLSAVSDAWRSQHGAATLVDWPGSAMRASGNEGVAGRIHQSIGSIGYVGAEFARRAGLRAALLENRAGHFVEPSSRNAAAALDEIRLPENLRAFVPDPAGRDSYPIVTLTWIVLHRSYANARTASELRDLLRWCLTDGQQFAGDLGYVPLPREITERALAAVDHVQAAPASPTRSH